MCYPWGQRPFISIIQITASSSVIQEWYTWIMRHEDWFVNNRNLFLIVLVAGNIGNLKSGPEHGSDVDLLYSLILTRGEQLGDSSLGWLSEGHKSPLVRAAPYDLMISCLCSEYHHLEGWDLHLWILRMCTNQGSSVKLRPKQTLTAL